MFQNNHFDIVAGCRDWQELTSAWAPPFSKAQETSCDTCGMHCIGKEGPQWGPNSFANTAQGFEVLPKTHRLIDNLSNL